MSSHPHTEAVAGDTRDRLIHAASEAFFASGYRASMEEIALHAGVAKQTLYNHFASKEELFGEVVRASTQRILVSLDGDLGGLRVTLIRFANAFRGMVLGAQCIAMYRTMIAESTRFPLLARAVYAVGPGLAIRQVADLLDKAMRAGQLRKDAPDFAAEMLLGMLSGAERTRYLLGIEQTLPEGDEAKAERIVDCFLRAYALIPENTKEKS